MLRAWEVQLFVRGGAVPESMLDLVRHPETGQFLGPVQPAGEEDKLERSFGIPQNLSEAEQDAQFKASLSNTVTVVVDTGVLHEHPLIRERIVGDVDFTGEGTEDHHGHGTVVAIKTGVVRFLPLLNLKVVSGAGYGSEEALVRALHYIRDYKYSHPETIVVANLSLGRYSRRWLFFRCRGGCRICQAARKVAEAGVRVMAAVGNSPGRTACPATLAIEGQKSVFAVEAPDVPSSGIGTVSASGQAPDWGPIS